MTEQTPDIAVALVGAGVISASHATVLRTEPGLRLACVIDTDPQAGATLAQAEGVKTYLSLADALAAGEQFSLVAVCVPTGTHAEIALQALAADKDVLIEKPADVTLDKVDQLIAAADRSGRLVSVVSQHRFDASVSYVLDQIRSGALGTITSGMSSSNLWRSQHYYDRGGWRGTWAQDGGGALMNQGVHALDIFVHLMGEPVEVFAYTGLLAHERIEVEDVAVAVVKFANGALGTLHAATASYPGLHETTAVMGTRGSVLLENAEIRYFHSADHDGASADYGVPVSQTNQVDQLAERGYQAEEFTITGGHARQYRDVVAALTAGRAPAVDLRTHRQSLQLLLAIYESARLGAPVKVGSSEHH